MVLVVASTVLTMACQGCVATPHEQAVSGPAVPPTVGMMMASPGSTAAPKDARADISVHVVDGLPNRFSGTPLGLGSEIAARAFAGTPADFSSGAMIATSIDAPDLTWSGTSRADGGCGRALAHFRDPPRCLESRGAEHRG
ncbi:MAG: hypothetical protein R3C00_08215 [Hyphomonas sp.]